MAASEHDLELEPVGDRTDDEVYRNDDAQAERNGRPPMPVPRPEGLPESVKLKPGGMLSPAEMRDLEAVTGRKLSEVLGEDDGLNSAPDRSQAMVWTVLRRLGHDVTWDEAALVLPEMGDEMDPTPGGGSPA